MDTRREAWLATSMAVIVFGFVVLASSLWWPVVQAAGALLVGKAAP